MVQKSGGYTLWQSDRIAAVITGLGRKSKNEKTGDMAQVWIIPRRVNPLKAVRTGADRDVCGDCQLRPSNTGQCYVRVDQAPNAVHKKYARGGYPFLKDFSILTGRKVRFGAWGDPFFVPVWVWKEIGRHCAGFTGYTHQWRNPLAVGLRPYVMASVNSPEEQIEATSLGWRTFRIRRPENPMFSDEISCPASDEAGNRTTCAKCLLCMGTSKGRVKNITIIAHGARARNFGL